MTIASLTQADLKLRDAIVRQLEWDSQLDASGIGVTAKNGAATLTGSIDSYAGKLAAERTAKRVRGVRAVANDLQVRLRFGRMDSEIAEDAARALNLRATLPDKVQAVVHSGHVTLTGTVHTLFQRAVAEKAVRHIRGIRGVVNRVTIEPGASGMDVRREIARALHRHADIDARGIQVLISGDEVTLTGAVRSRHERESAERAASHATGVTRVDNRISVVEPEMVDEGEEDAIC